MREPKFKVADVLKPILDETGLIKFHVLEVLTQKCESGIEQILYRCRIHAKQFRGSPAAITKALFDFNEMEVEPWKANENQKTAKKRP